MGGKNKRNNVRQKHGNDKGLPPTGEQTAAENEIKTKIRSKMKKHGSDYRRKKPNGNNLNINMAVTMLVLSFVVVAVAIYAYYWYISTLRERIRTPLEVPKLEAIIDGIANDETDLNDTNRIWGSYRSGLYFGLKTRNPNSPVVGASDRFVIE